MKSPLLYLTILITLSSCIKANKFERLIIWEEIQKSIRENNVDFLMSISSDTLSCIECNNGESNVFKEAFFLKHIKQLRQSKNQKYIVHVENNDSIKNYTVN